MAAALNVSHPSAPATVFIGVESAAPNMFNTDVMLAVGLRAFCSSPYMTIAVPACIRGHLSTIARSKMKCLLTTVTASATAVVNKDDMLDASETVESSHMSPEAVVPRKRCCKQ